MLSDEEQQFLADNADCKGMDPNDFFPDEPGSYSTGFSRTIIDLCNNCPARRECLLSGMNEGYYANEVGIWGGASARKRRRLKNAAYTRMRNGSLTKGQAFRQIVKEHFDAIDEAIHRL